MSGLDDLTAEAVNAVGALDGLSRARTTAATRALLDGLTLARNKVSALWCAMRDEEDRGKLTYSRSARCPCGRGLAYYTSRAERQERGWPDAWVCAGVLLDQVGACSPLPPAGFGVGKTKDTGGAVHEIYPWTFYEIKSENETPGLTETTRPAAEVKP